MYEYLDAINFVLSQIGSSPVTSADINTPDVIGAKNKLEEASNWLQKKGWYFNTEINTLYPRDIEDEISVPNNALKVKDASEFVVIRNRKFYAPRRSSYTFTEDVTATLVVKLPWEELTVAAQDFIRFRAAGIYVLTELEDLNKAAVLGESEREAHIDIKKEELQCKPRNYLQSPKILRTRAGVRPYRRGGGSNPYMPGG